MRRLRTTLATTIAAALLASSAVAVAAQSDEAAEAAYFTGQIGASEVLVEQTETLVDGVTELRGLVRQGPIETTDPRMTGSLTRVLNTDIHTFSDDVWTVHYSIENEAGSWSGLATSLAHYPPGDPAGVLDLDTVILTGDGDYAGLSAYMLADWTPDVGADLQGLVFPGEMPPNPEPFTSESS